MIEFTFVFAAIFFVLIAAGITQHRKRVGVAWDQAARHLGLRFEAGSLFSSRSMRGRIGGHFVIIDTFTRSTGKSSATFTRYRVRYSVPIGLGVRLTREGFLSGVGKMLGAQDIQIGDREFDPHVIVKGDDADRVREFLTPARKQRVLRLLSSLSGSVIDDHQVHWVKRGVETNVERIVSTTKQMTGLADYFVVNRRDDPLERVLEVAREGRIEDAIEVMRQRPREDRDRDVEGRLLEGELLMTGGRYDESKAVLEGVERELEDDREVKGLVDLARARVDQREPSAPPPLPQREADDWATICEDLFSSDRMSFEVNERFEERYMGSRVQWSGVLERLDDYITDMVLPGSGTRAVFALGEFDSGGFGGSSVQAVLGLPQGVREKLQPRLLSEVAFSGELIRCDSFLRTLFVANGKIEA